MNILRADYFFTFAPNEPCKEFYGDTGIIILLSVFQKLPPDNNWFVKTCHKNPKKKQKQDGCTMVSVYYKEGATDGTLFKLIFSVLKRKIYKQLYWQIAWLI